MPDDVPKVELLSYRYVRITIIILVAGIGIAVLLETLDHGLLTSVSAYYYSPAQTIFIGGLIALAACMIALKGNKEREDYALNLGGMFAAVVAVVPTTLNEAVDEAVIRCHEFSGDPADCPTAQALLADIRMNVDNSMWTLLPMGGIALIVTAYFMYQDRGSRAGTGAGRWDTVKMWLGFGVVAAVLVFALVSFLRYHEGFIDHAHYVAAIGLGLCIFFVTLSGALRRDPVSATMQRESWLRRAFAYVRPLLRWPLGRYAILGWAMILVALIMVPLWLTDRISLFWLEIAEALLFVAFWAVQTHEWHVAGKERRPPPGTTTPATAGVGSPVPV